MRIEWATSRATAIAPLSASQYHLDTGAGNEEKEGSAPPNGRSLDSSEELRPPEKAAAAE